MQVNESMSSPNSSELLVVSNSSGLQGEVRIDAAQLLAVPKQGHRLFVSLVCVNGAGLLSEAVDPSFNLAQTASAIVDVSLCISTTYHLFIPDPNPTLPSYHTHHIPPHPIKPHLILPHPA